MSQVRSLWKGPVLAPFAYLGRCEEIARAHDLTLRDLQRPGRFRHMVNARIEITGYLREERGWSFPQIGRFFGHADHSSAMNLYGHFKAGSCGYSGGRAR